jgi:hypothetical protein
MEACELGSSEIARIRFGDKVKTVGPAASRCFTEWAPGSSECRARFWPDDAMRMDGPGYQDGMPRGPGTRIGLQGNLTPGTVAFSSVGDFRYARLHA